jgi:hypothetical protein
MRINVKHDVERIVVGLDDLAQRQIPFATARALTMTARDAQSDLRAEMPKRFTLRTSRVNKGIRITPATKGNLAAVVGSIDWFMRDQETGGTRKASGHRIAVPKGVRRTKRDLISKALRPTPVRDKPRVFLVKAASGAGIMQRQGQGRCPITALYWLKKSVSIKPRFGFKAQVEATVRDRFESNFMISLSQAISRSA